jgi:hypothetical protein
MPTEGADSTERVTWRSVRKLGATTSLALVASLLPAGCAGTASLLRPAPEATGSLSEPLFASAPLARPASAAKVDAAVVRAQADTTAEATQVPAESPTATAVPALPAAPVADLPPSSAPVELTAPFVEQPVRTDGGGTLYRYDPMRGAVLSPIPPANRGITLRELLGLGRSDIADKEIEVRPDYPDLHDDPLARSPVSPSQRKRPLFPALSNLIVEHERELNEDADDEREEQLTRRSDYDITLPGPDTANFPNSAFTLPKGRIYIENSPASFFGKSRSFPAQYNWEYLLRYGITDDLEFRLFSGGYSATLSKPYTTGVSPLTFDFKYHMWDENLDKHIPAAASEIYIQTSFGSNFFTGGTQPSIALLLDHTLPFDVLLEHNFGLTGIADTFGGSIYEFSYQWALQRQVFKDFAIFTHGFLNSAALPRLPIFQRHVRRDFASIPLTPADSSAGPSNQLTSPPTEVVVGAGFLWNLSKRLAVYGSYNVGLAADSPKIIALLGFAVAL